MESQLNKHPMELHVCGGADSELTLYEDEGDTYDYEKAEYDWILISWNEAKHTLEIGRRTGKFSGMLKERAFNIIWVSKDHGAGVSSTEKPDAGIHYQWRYRESRGNLDDL